MKLPTLLTLSLVFCAAAAFTGCMASAPAQPVPAPVPQPAAVQPAPADQEAPPAAKERVRFGLAFVVPSGWQIKEEPDFTVLGDPEDDLALLLVSGSRADLPAMRAHTHKSLANYCSNARFGQTARGRGAGGAYTKQFVDCTHEGEPMHAVVLTMSADSGRAAEVLVLASSHAADGRLKQAQAIIEGLRFTDAAEQPAAIRETARR